jgi:opacity protein-like surface antigen
MTNLFKKTGLLVGVSLSVLTLSAEAGFAADPVAPDSGYQPYVSVFGGASLGENVHTVFNPAPGYIQDTKMDVGYLVGAAVGLRWNDFLRSEIEVAYGSNSANHLESAAYGVPYPNTPATGTIGAAYLLGNIWADWKNNSPLTPYAGGGVGVAFVKNSGVDFSGIYGFADSNQTRLAWQLGAGIKYDISDSMALDIGYRYLNVNNLYFVNTNLGAGGDFNGNMHTHIVRAGLTFNF